MAVVEFQLHDIGELLSFIEEQGEVGKKAVSYTIKDIKSRAPGWVASEVSSVYNIKKTEIIPARTEESRNKKAVSVYASGSTLETVSIVYRGRTLTPIHFSMTPKKPSRQKVGRRAIPGEYIKFGNRTYGAKAIGLAPIYKKYIISYEVRKGSRRIIEGKKNLQTPFLAPVEAGSNKYIVFQRKGESRTDMYSLRTVSVPQMLGNKQVREKIEKRVYDTTEQRLQYHVNRFASKE